ncbi:hypothetical protein [uncultured Sphingomonas sp.]|uniref:hypothetical protein n=1 Tax=uncultured Sphingomonas sp. TaxID=158754 RepID=UPI0025F0E90A|nr:hypothetical protein [uncultured Sphingomonas sp.]
MILAAFLLAQTIPSPGAAPESDVVVTARKLQALDIRLKRRRGTLVCQYKSSSGDPALDAAACAVGVDCYHKAKGVADLKACVIAGMTALVTPQTDQANIVSTTPALERNRP